jgi:hypothetical protein
MLSGSSTSVIKLNTAAARKAGRTTIVHKINCNLERDILFLASMRKPSNRPVRPCQIRTIATANSAINMIQSAVMASGGRPNHDNTTSENQQTSATAAIRTSNPILCHGFHPVSVAAAASV